MSGYREENFDLDTQEPEEPLSPEKARGATWIVIAFAILFFVLLDLLSWFNEGGGLLSLLPTLSSQAKPAVIDIDKASLQLPIMLTLLLGIGFACRLLGLKLNLSTRRAAWLPTVLFMGAVFLIDGVFGETVITRYMDAQGYVRCTSQDHEQGTGKGIVWFANYVVRASDCRSKTGKP